MSYSCLDPEADRAAVVIRPVPDTARERLATLPAAKLVRLVAATVAKPFGCQCCEIFSLRRTARVVAARHATAAICREVAGVSSLELGQLMRRDHAAILYALGSVRDRLQTDRLFRSRYDCARRALGLPPL